MKIIEKKKIDRQQKKNNRCLDKQQAKNIEKDNDLLESENIENKEVKKEKEQWLEIQKNVKEEKYEASIKEGETKKKDEKTLKDRSIETNDDELKKEGVDFENSIKKDENTNKKSMREKLLLQKEYCQNVSSNCHNGVCQNDKMDLPKMNEPIQKNNKILNKENIYI